MRVKQITKGRGTVALSSEANLFAKAGGKAYIEFKGEGVDGIDLLKRLAEQFDLEPAKILADLGFTPENGMSEGTYGAIDYQLLVHPELKNLAIAATFINRTNDVYRLPKVCKIVSQDQMLYIRIPVVVLDIISRN